ncbi:hypothetical protein CL614_07480 [archaeon]|nr:hypothetical protein [archaeon]|tara:strand:- start:1267 stop:1983 length:717 start_codon:yes stop_codon:yes gene_type:complete
MSLNRFLLTFKGDNMENEFCIKCGKKSVKKSNFCEKCIQNQYDLFSVKNVTAQKCRVCKLYEVGRKWVAFKDDKEAALEIAQNNIKILGDISDIKLKAKDMFGKYQVKVSAKGAVHELGTDVVVKKKETRTMMVIFRRLKCDICVKMSGNYYEALIQLRGDKKDKLLKETKLIAREKDIVAIEDKKEGYDVRIMFKTNAKRIISIIKRRKLSKMIKKSYKDKGEKKGKKLYRDYYSVR